MSERVDREKPPTLGWVVSEIYAIVRRLEAVGPRLTVGEVSERDAGRWATQMAERDARIEELEGQVETLEGTKAALLEGRLQTVGGQRDAWTLRRSEEDWQALIAQVNDVTRQRDELVEMVRTPTTPIQNEPYLGLATTEQMIMELVSRCGSWPASRYFQNVDRIFVFGKMLGEMTAEEREYRTVTSD